MLNMEHIKARLESPDTRDIALSEVAKWIADTCLLFGSTSGTAFIVAGEFVKGLKNEYE